MPAALEDVLCCFEDARVSRSINLTELVKINSARAGIARSLEADFESLEINAPRVRSSRIEAPSVAGNEYAGERGKQ